MFRTNKISFFGVIFSQNGISPNPAKVKAVRAFSHSQNLKDLISLLGMTIIAQDPLKVMQRFVALYENLITKKNHGNRLKHVKEHL